MMGDIEYEIRGFLTVRRDSLRVPLRGSLTVRVVPGSGHFTGSSASACSAPPSGSTLSPR
jgi:hypothetical protein